MPERGRYMISVAADLAGLHPQTLRMYEARRLVTPARTPGGTRLYSDADVERLYADAERGGGLLLVVAARITADPPATSGPLLPRRR